MHFAFRRSREAQVGRESIRRGEESSHQVEFDRSDFGEAAVTIVASCTEADFDSIDQMRADRSAAFHRSDLDSDARRPNHALEATAYRTALELLVRLGLFRLPTRLASQGCASALIR